MNTKHLAIIYIFILSFGTILSLYIPKNEVTANSEIVIPKEAIRLRILANSDSEKDQQLKRKVRDAVNHEINGWVENLTSVESARSLIRSRLLEIQRIAEQVVASEKSTQSVHTDFGKVEFPTKLYGQYLYPAGEYEAILITLGEGKGANWWCVLFPPLCFLDFASGVAVKEDEKSNDSLEGSENRSGEGSKRSENKEQTSSERQDLDLDKAPDTKQNQGQSQDSKQAPPVYTEEDEKPVEVKFFIKVLWDKLR